MPIYQRNRSVAYFLTLRRKSLTMKHLSLTLIFSLFLINCFAQQKTEQDFTTYNRHLIKKTEGAAQVIDMDENENPGIAWIKGQRFSNGTIDVDMKGRDMQQRSFLGIAFHGANDTTYEAIYFRPFNFRATDPEHKVHALEYIALPQFDWPKLRSEHHNQYEKGVNPIPDPMGWFHARIEVHGEMVKVYVNASTTPSLVITSLTHTGGEMIGYWVGNGSDGSWKNLKIVAAGN
jgi:hypothetical protein